MLASIASIRGRAAGGEESYRTGVEVAAALIVADLAVIALHMLHEYLPRRVFELDLFGRGFYVDTEGGFGECFQYAKLGVTAGLLLLIYARRRAPSYLALAVVFAYLLLDDAFQIHEFVGLHLVSRLGLAGLVGARPQDSGELIVMAATGSVLLAQLALAYRASGTEDRRPVPVYLALLILLAFFGVFVDMLHMALRGIVTGLALVEDGGEMLVVSLIVAYTACLYRERGMPAASPAPSRGPEAGVGAEAG
jgi:hypothetical protein